MNCRFFRSQVVLFAAAVLLAGSSTTLATDVTSDITTNTTWTEAGSPYIIKGAITVTPSATLTITGAVTVQFDSARSLTVLGRIVADGPGKVNGFYPLTFMTFPGQTRGFLSFANPSQASELTQVLLSSVRLEFSGRANIVSSQVFDSPTTAYAGPAELWNVEFRISPTILYSGAQVAMNSVTLRECSGDALDVKSGATLTAMSGVITANGGYAIITEPGASLPEMPSVAMSGNGGGTNKNYVAHRGGTVSGSDLWRRNIPWLLLNDLSVPTGKSLTLQAGATVKVAYSKGISAAGTLTAQGTAPARISLLPEGTSPTTGFWKGLRFLGGTGTLAYLDISNAGYALQAEDRAGIALQSGALSASNIVVTMSKGAGIRLQSASATATLQSSTVSNTEGTAIIVGAGALSASSVTLSGSTQDGLDVKSGATLTSISGVITANGGYAIITEPGGQLPSVAGVVMTSNGPGGSGNVVAHRGGSISSADQWRGGAPWLLLADADIVANGVLTLDPGLTVRMSQNRLLWVHGTLVAVGSPALPITFTSSQTSPSPGYWGGIRLDPSASPQSFLSHAIVEYAGAAVPTQAAIAFLSGSHTVDHVTVRHSSGNGVMASGGSLIATLSTIQSASGAGLRVGGNAIATLLNSRLEGNGLGLANDSPTNPLVEARLNFWGHSSGPSGAGPGTGQPVSSRVLYNPWLTRPADEDKHFVSASVQNQIFNATIGVRPTISFETLTAGNWQLTIRDSANTTVASYQGTGTSGTVVWDQSPLAGSYSFDIESTPFGGTPVASARGWLLNDTNRALVSGFSVTPSFMSPNGDGIKDTVTLSAEFGFECVDWLLTVHGVGPDPVRSSSGTCASAVSYVWDGRNGGGAVVPDGEYTLRLVATLAPAVEERSQVVTVDCTAPSAAIAFPTPDQVLSNIYQDGSTTVEVVGSAGDQNLLDWVLTLTPGSQLASGVAPVSNTRLVLWETNGIENRGYTLQLAVRDHAGNVTTVNRPVVVGNFSISQNKLEFNGGAGQTITYTSIVPFSLAQTLVIKDQTGAIRRTLVAGTTRPAGTYHDIWNGRDNSGVALLADGLYRFVTSVSANGYVLNWDLTGDNLCSGCYQQPNDCCRINNSLAFSEPFDPFKGLPLRFSFNVTDPGLVTIAVGNPSYHGPCDVNPSLAICLTTRKPYPTGTHTFEWAGVDAAGGYVAPSLTRLTLVWDRDQWSRNAVLLFGTSPTLQNLAVTPPVLSSLAGGANVAFQLSTYQGQSVAVTLQFINQTSKSVLRTIFLPSQPPGQLTVHWDGLADNGMPVAPGGYTVRIKAEDGIANQVVADVLATVRH